MTTPTAERVDLPVSGMTCAACARAIERTLSATAGVERASVNLATNTATCLLYTSPWGTGWTKIAVGLPDWLAASAALDTARSQGACH